MRYFVHHLNDLSGSPLILRERIARVARDEPVTLITNHGRGFLSDWNGPTLHFSYIKHECPFRRFLSLSLWYLRVAVFLLLHLCRGDSVVISTLISSPLLAVLRLRRQVTAELMVNEVFFRVPLWRRLGLALANSYQVKKIYLSRYVQDSWEFCGPGEIVYPWLREDLVRMSDAMGNNIPAKDRDRLTFFLVGSQIEAKGYRLFIEIARHFASVGAGHRFALFLSGSPERFAGDYPAGRLPENLEVRFNDTSPTIFAGKDIFLGLTNPAIWVETFGQTFAEAMIMGNIVVVPPKGGQLEYVSDGENGFVFKQYSVEGILDTINRILAHENLSAFAIGARRSMRAFYGYP